VHLLVAAVLAAERGVALVHEDVAVAAERLGAERAGVQRVPPGLAQRLRVEEEGAGHGRRHASVCCSLAGLDLLSLRTKRACWLRCAALLDACAALESGQEGGKRVRACEFLCSGELGSQRSRPGAYLSLRAEENDKRD
jgi:hypothetical protein